MHKCSLTYKYNDSKPNNSHVYVNLERTNLHAHTNVQMHKCSLSYTYELVYKYNHLKPNNSHTSLNLQRTNLHVHTSLNCAKFDDSIAPIPCVPVHQYHIHTSLIREPNNHVSINLTSHVCVNLAFNLNLFEFHIINTHNLTHKCYRTLLVKNTQ